MRRIAAAFLFCVCTLAWSQQLDLDWRVINQEWEFIKQQTGAPNDLPMPNIIIDPTLPSGARMMFQFPTKQDSVIPMQIMINPKTLVEYNREMIDWGVGHELTHYAFVMRENNWEYTKEYFAITQKHHCNREFMRITKELADVIYNVYHGERERYAMWDQVQRSCVTQPNQ